MDACECSFSGYFPNRPSCGRTRAVIPGTQEEETNHVLPSTDESGSAFEAPTVNDIPGTVRDEVARLNLSSQVKAGQTIAISVGSRGIANIA